MGGGVAGAPVAPLLGETVRARAVGPAGPGGPVAGPAAAAVVAGVPVEVVVAEILLTLARPGRRFPFAPAGQADHLVREHFAPYRQADRTAGGQRPPVAVAMGRAYVLQIQAVAVDLPRAGRFTAGRDDAAARGAVERRRVVTAALERRRPVAP